MNTERVMRRKCGVREDFVGFRSWREAHGKYGLSASRPSRERC
jgi:hypothetical protein